LENIGNNDIERKSLIVFGESFLGIGIMTADLKFSGKVSCAIHLLKNLVKKGVSTTLLNLINLGEILSKPGAESVLILLI